MIDRVKEQGLVITISTVATMIPVLAATWFLIQPIIVSSVEEQLSATFDRRVEDRVQKSVEPLNDAFKAILLSDINKLKRRISNLEFQRERDENWSSEQERELTDLRIELGGLLRALDQLNRQTDDD